ncbi:Oidioi.mRNA.OKI2018_I69.XSR.g14470.t1.cds [Oikopleura dioica]|uniref:Oidioi.mRNA.OKI2018_I69.XSR.g14470.t1.cds n=1 Tax=Oikopleura dioica TaxID=34765 RepID=A0ABN7SF42_OIKDI|nr:Oidioi.mRNA.OKI2018_I69.XSR.g14470.t1.cds [Oikopleura dioica]
MQFQILMNSKKNDMNLKRQNALSSEQHIAPKITKLETYHADTNSNLLDQQEPNSSCNETKKKTRGRVKIDIEFMKDKQKRCTTFSKRKSGLMKKSYELATLTGSQVMVLVASETGHVYTYATKKFQPVLNSTPGRKLIQTCLASDNNSIEEETFDPEIEITVDEDDDDNTPISPLAVSAGMSNSHSVNEPPQAGPHNLHEPMPPNPSDSAPQCALTRPGVITKTSTYGHTMR